MSHLMMHVAVVGGADKGGMTLSVTRGFTAVGCRADLVPYVEWMPNFYRPNVRGSGIAERVMGSIFRPVVEARLLRAIRSLRPDLVLLVKCDDLHRSTLRSLRRLGPTLFAFHPDDPFNSRPRPGPGPSHRRAATQMREVDAYFVWSGALVAQAKGRGARAHYLPFASDMSLHHPVETTAEERSSVRGRGFLYWQLGWRARRVGCLRWSTSTLPYGARRIGLLGAVMPSPSRRGGAAN